MEIKKHIEEIYKYNKNISFDDLPNTELEYTLQEHIKNLFITKQLKFVGNDSTFDVSINTFQYIWDKFKTSDNICDYYLLCINLCDTEYKILSDKHNLYSAQDDDEDEDGTDYHLFLINLNNMTYTYLGYEYEERWMIDVIYKTFIEQFYPNFDRIENPIDLTNKERNPITVKQFDDTIFPKMDFFATKRDGDKSYSFMCVKDSNITYYIDKLSHIRYPKVCNSIQRIHLLYQMHKYSQIHLPQIDGDKQITINGENISRTENSDNIQSIDLWGDFLSR